MESNQQGLKILCVEDEPGIREQLLRLLQRRGNKVLGAKNGKEGLALYREYSPEIVVTDIRMPVMDGLTMIKEIKEISRDVKTIVTTAFTDFSYMMDAIDLGVDHYVVKPINIDNLLGSIDKCAENISCRTVARQYLKEREKLITELHAALNKVKQLSGFLPICASCKKIRNDKGYWQQIESYIRAHSEAEFSHGICPDCAYKLYPECFSKK
ncbi:MAG: response regulator [Proteobacteria bacterium]|nr:response regulator [Desulfobulbaceae bacterium]MBU4153545.1 response regulator [Pseudomonadota bacterium]